MWKLTEFVSLNKHFVNMALFSNWIKVDNNFLFVVGHGSCKNIQLLKMQKLINCEFPGELPVGQEQSRKTGREETKSWSLEGRGVKCHLLSRHQIRNGYINLQKQQFFAEYLCQNKLIRLVAWMGKGVLWDHPSLE